MIAATIMEWLPMFVLAGIAMTLSAASMKMRLPWFVGAPLAGITSIVAFELIGRFVLDEREKFLYVALVFGAVYATGLALLPYSARFLIAKLRRPKI